MNWEGFLMGVSDFGLERLKEERNKKMLKELEELKETHRIAAEKRQEKLLAKKVHRTGEDAEGREQDYNVFGGTVGESREQSPWVSEQRNMEREKHDDTLETSASTRNYQTRSLDLRGQELSERRKAREAGMGGGGANISMDDDAAIEQIFQPILKDAKTLPERAFLLEQAHSVYTDALSSGGMSQAQMRTALMQRLNTPSYGGDTRGYNFYSNQD